MAATNTRTTLAAATKHIVNDVIKDLRPASAILQEIAPFKEIGRDMLYPVVATHELGFTFSSSDAFTYNASIAAEYPEATIDSNPVILRSQWGYEAADRLSKKGKKAVEDAVTIRTANMKTSLMKVLEATSLYGRWSKGLGEVEAVNDSSGTNVLTITAKTWCPALWGGMKGVQLDAYTSTTLQNSNGALELTVINFDDRKLTVTGAAADTAAIDVGSYLVYRGSYSAAQYGLFYQLDTSGSVFGISNSTYELWKGVEHDVSGALTFTQILKGLSKAVSRGGLDGDVVLLVAPATYESMNSDIIVMQALDQSFSSSKVKVGTKSIVINSAAGMIEIMVHPLMMDGYALSFPREELLRIGSCDTTFSLPGGTGDREHIEYLESTYAYQVICRASWQIFVGCPAKCVMFYNITNP